MAIKTRSRKAAQVAKKPQRPLSNAQLLKLAAKRRPPQSWYDEHVDLTKPESNGKM